MTQADFQSILPILALLAWAVALLVLNLFTSGRLKGWVPTLAVIGMAVALGLNIAQNGIAASAFGGMIMVDGFAVFLNAIYLISGIVTIGLAYDFLKRTGIERGEFYVLMMFSIAGMMLISEAYNLIVVFLALELLSIPLYILAGFARPRVESEESALKYFLLGTFSSAFILYGIALIFGATATTQFDGIIAAVASGNYEQILFIAGASLVLVGFGFKVSAAPFHEWAPDVYQGAPSPVSSFMAVAVKAAGFAALLRVFITIFPGAASILMPVSWVLAALTMLVGNVLAISQSNIKRLLAYSSISHAGYLLMAFVAYGNPIVSGQAVAAMLYYLVTYGITTLGAWAVVVALEQAEGKGLELADYAGLGRKYAWLGVAMLVFMLSLAGVPITIGFWGKFFLLRSAVQAGNIGLAVIAVLTSLISAFYYLRVVVYMFMHSGEPRVRRDSWLNLVVIAAALAVVVLSLLPNQVLQMAMNAVIRLQ